MVLEIVKNGKPMDHLYLKINDQPLYVRIQRLDGVLNFVFGPDGKTWISPRKLAITFPPKVQVGLAVSNMSKEPLNAQFEEFELITDPDLLNNRKNK